MGKEFQGVISTELGGANTAIAFYTAAMLGKYIIDAIRREDGARAATFYLLYQQSSN